MVTLLFLGKQMKKIGSYLVVMVVAFSAGMVGASVLYQNDTNNQIVNVPSATVDTMGNVSNR